MAERLDYEPEIQTFLTWFRKNLCAGKRGNDDAPFMPEESLMDYLESPGRVARILRALWPNGDLPCSPDSVLRRCPKVLSILLLIGMGHFIRQFHQYNNLCDSALPIGLEAGRPTNFPSAPDDVNFYRKFYETQWMFCVPEIHNVEDVFYSKEYILPIIHMERLSESGSAVI